MISADVGGTTMKVAEVSPDGRVLDSIEMASPAREHGRSVVAELARILRERWGNAACLGVGAAGVIDPATGTVLEASDSFQGWRGFELRAELEASLGIPVYVENDVNAFLLGEQRFGVAAGHRDCLGLMLGTGVGGAVILDERLRSGPRGAAAELGHMPVWGSEPCTCGTPGHLESLASGRSIARRFSAARGTASALVDGAREVAEAADGGDTVARRVLAEAGEAVGMALVQAATMFDLSAVVVGGSVSASWHWLEPGVTTITERYPLISGSSLQILHATRGSDAVLLGAASLADAASPSKGDPC